MRKNIITDRLILRSSDDRRDLENYIKHIKDEDRVVMRRLEEEILESYDAKR